jgi:hypothetical protein
MRHARSDFFNARRCLLLAVMLLVGESSHLLAQSIDEELPLPRWADEKPVMPLGAEPGSQFNSLLPSDPLDESPGMLQSGPRLADAPPTLMPGYSELGPMDLSLFLHGSILQSSKLAAAPRLPTPVMSLRELPPELLTALADSPANEYLLDPQNLLQELPRQDLERLLAFHASQARVRLYLLVLDKHQKLPDVVNLDALAHGALTRQHACLTVFPLGEPWRTRFLMSQSVHESVSAASLNELAADCIQDAQQVDDSAQQLQRLSVRLSTRLFWLEKGLGKATQTAHASLHEVTSNEAPTSLPSSPGSLWPLWQILLIGAFTVSSLILIFVITKHYARRRKPENSRVWILPDIEVTPRLGGAFSGGSAAVLTFKR